MKPLKPKKCRACRESYQPNNSMQVVCSAACGLLMARQARERKEAQLAKEERKQTRERKQRIKTRAEYLREAQVAFNAWIRERDRYKPCISCGVTYPEDRVNVWDAGHLRSVGASSSTRFNTYNVNKQCVRCNRYLSSNAMQYRIGLVEKIGLEKVEALYAAPAKAYFTVEYLVRLKNVFRRRLKILKKIREKKGGHNGGGGCC